MNLSSPNQSSKHQKGLIILSFCNLSFLILLQFLVKLGELDSSFIYVDSKKVDHFKQSPIQSQEYVLFLQFSRFPDLHFWRIMKSWWDILRTILHPPSFHQEEKYQYRPFDLIHNQKYSFILSFSSQSIFSGEYLDKIISLQYQSTNDCQFLFRLRLILGHPKAALLC